jgi:hypothetical protein
MNPTPLSRIQTFREHVLLPALKDLEALLEGTKHQVVIANTAETGNEAVDTMLQQMHFGKPYLPSTSSSLPESLPSSTLPQAWIGDSFYVETLRNSEAESSRVDQYCLSIEFRILSVEHIQVCAIVGYTKAEDKALQIQHHLFEETLNPQSLEQIKEADIALHFVESYEAFESNLPAPEAMTEETLDAETLASDRVPPSPS